MPDGRRLRAWYEGDDAYDGATWPDRDLDETMEHYIVRNDVYPTLHTTTANTARPDGEAVALEAARRFPDDYAQAGDEYGRRADFTEGAQWALTALTPTVTAEQVEAAARALLDHENDTWSKEARDRLWQATEAIGVQDEYRGQVAVVLDALGISHDGPHWEEVQP